MKLPFRPYNPFFNIQIPPQVKYLPPQTVLPPMKSLTLHRTHGLLLCLALAGTAFQSRAADGKPDPAFAVPADWKVAEGYTLEVLHAVNAATEGSWVSLAAGPADATHEILFASDQYGALFQLKVPRAGGQTAVTRLSLDLGHAQGLLWHGGRLFAVVNQSGRSGLYVVEDTDHDGLPDKARKMFDLAGEGEHGPHGITLAADGKHLLVLCGNHTKPPANLAWSRLTRPFAEGLLEPREWDPNGHARNVMAPGGYLLEVDPDSGAAGLVAGGMRNSYDVATTPSGEMYTFDSDMEWDMGAPWYRPTRLIQLVSGGDYGWRSGSGKWPVWRQDGLPPVTDVGPGSPTGVLTGAGAKFPAPDQRALYILDWTFGTVFRARLTETGASHGATLEPFLTGRGLPLSDAVIGSDGAMYLTAGGRKTGSRLLRIRYTGSEATVPAAWPEPNAAARRRLALEAFHTQTADDAGLDLLLTALADPDRSIRFAARVGLEHQDKDRWVPRLAGLRDPLARILGWLGALRATPEAESPLVDAALTDLGLVKPQELTEEPLLAWLRAHQWALMNRPAAATRWRDRLLLRLDKLYPHAQNTVNAELAVLLVHLKAPGVAGRTLDLMESAQNPPVPAFYAEHIARNPQYGNAIADMIRHPPPTEGLRFAFALRQLNEGWTLADRERYFRWIRQVKTTKGGMSFQGFVNIMQAQALANCDATTRMRLQPLLAPPDSGSGFAMRGAAGPGHSWIMEEAMPALSGRLAQADLKRGEGLFGAYCAACHHLEGRGGSVGPDLTSASGKFSLHDLVEAVVDPDKSVSDQYQLQEWVFKDGTRKIARYAGSAPDGQLEYIENMMNPAAVSRVKPDQVVSHTPSPHSPMPPQLTWGMNADELRDLIAFVASGAGTRREWGDWQGKPMAAAPPAPGVVTPPFLSPAGKWIFGAAIGLMAALVGLGALLSVREARRK